MCGEKPWVKRPSGVGSLASIGSSCHASGEKYSVDSVKDSGGCFRYAGSLICSRFLEKKRFSSYW